MDAKRTLRERAFQFGLAVFRMAPAVRGHGVEFVNVAGQLSRSGTAIGALLEEGSVAASRKDMAHKHEMALREARETVYWLRLLRESGFAASAMSELEREAGELSAMLTASVRRLRAPRTLG